jgi:NAD dependent epimerase/dehydratase family enzyme
MLTPFKLGLGGKIGFGHQWWSWIHIDDIVGAIHHAIQNSSIAGPVNLVGPNPVRNEEFTRVLASVLRRPAFFRVPASAASAVFGKEAAEELLPRAERVDPAIPARAAIRSASDLRLGLADLLERSLAAQPRL